MEYFRDLFTPKTKRVAYPVRSFADSFNSDTNQTVKLFEEYTVMGIDLFIHNLSITSISVVIYTTDDRRISATVRGGDTFFFSDIPFHTVTVTATTQSYELHVAGVYT